MFLSVGRKSRVKNQGSGIVWFIIVYNTFDVTTIDRFRHGYRIGKGITIFGPVPTKTFFRHSTFLSSSLNPLSTIQSNPLSQFEKVVQLRASTGDRKGVLSIILDCEDSWQRHVDALKQFGIYSTGKRVEWIKEWVGGELDSTRNIPKDKPKTGNELKIKGIKAFRDGRAVEVVLAKSHGERGVF